MAQTISATAIVSNVELASPNAKIQLTSVAVKKDGTPTFTMAIDLPWNHPVVAFLQEDQIISIRLEATGGVSLQNVSQVIQSEAPEQEEVVLPPRPATSGGPTEWNGSAAVTDPMLVNAKGKDMLKDAKYRETLGLVPLEQLLATPAPTTAEAVPSSRSQYAGDNV